MTISVALRTIHGERVEVSICCLNPTITDVVAALMLPPHNYAPGVELMFAGKVLHHHRHLEEFPDGGVMIVGQTLAESDALAHQAAAAARAAEVHPNLHFHHAASPARGGSHPGTPMDAGQQQPNSGTSAGGNRGAAPGASPRARFSPTTPPPATGKGSPAASPPPPPTAPPTSPPLPVLIHIAAPTLQKTCDVHVGEGATVGDLLIHAVAAEARLAGAKLIHGGKLLDKPRAVLREIGLLSGMTVHAALGPITPEMIRLDQIEQRLHELREAIGTGTVTVDQKKAYYEESMKALLQLDQMMDLEGELRTRRKALVHEIHHLQDSMGIHL